MKITKKQLRKLIKEAYVRRYKYIDPSDRTNVTYEDVKAPSNLSVENLTFNSYNPETSL